MKISYWEICQFACYFHHSLRLSTSWLRKKQKTKKLREADGLVKEALAFPYPVICPHFDEIIFIFYGTFPLDNLSYL